LLPMTINTGESVGWAVALPVNLFLLSLWTVQHSVMARSGFKQQLMRLIPESAERSTYILMTGIALAVVIHFWQGNATVVWSLSGLEMPLRVLSLFGWTVMVWSTFEIDHFDLFGLKQPFCNLTGREYTQREFVTPFLYRYVRHPLQLGILIGMWSQAQMSQGQLGLAAGMTLYIFIGLFFEERDLVKHFGQRYLTYMAQVPRLIPRPGKRVRDEEAPQ
jgi:protein-S-isoprenylcysteine O-methyltransferase Ste14